MRNLFLPLLLLMAALGVRAGVLDDIRRTLEESSTTRVQEKVYLHLDNNCYFKGDTIWYKSYVVRADDLTFTDMSRILYVELVSPDGLVVERQNLIVSADGYGDGCFELKDSLYSGYYELRAYTRWMLNFCVTEHPYTRTDREQFYNRQMAKDFFRQFGTVYSRVVPVYERPDSAGDYSQKYIVSRPKARLDKEQKEELHVNFYPEGGHLIGGTRCTVAFEALNEEGELVDVEGKMLNVEGDISFNTPHSTFRTPHQGRGVFTVDVPESGRLKASFNYRGKDYTFDLPKTEQQGCALHVDAVADELTATVTLKGINQQVGVAILCRGVLKHFETLTASGTITIDKTQLPTGVCDLIVIDDEGHPLADRLFFVNHHDYDLHPITVSGAETDYQPYAPITLTLQTSHLIPNTQHLSISVRDGSTDDPIYDTGNIMTDLLLSSDLKGFVAYPDYYFEADDQQHRQALDLLMMVQGWRRYDYAELTNTATPRYTPEKTMTVEGAVYKTVDFDDLRECELGFWLRNIFGWCEEDSSSLDPEDPRYKELVEGLNTESESTLDGSMQLETMGETVQEATPQSVDEPNYGVNHRGLNYEVTLEGELAIGEEVATVQMETTDGGRFAFNVPPYYGDAILFLSAHKTDASDKKLRRLETKGRLDEDAWPEYYVKRDLFFPIFARKYDYYQCHQPEATSQASLTSHLSPLTSDQTPDIERISKFDAQLQNIDVSARRRRGRHAIDYSKPAYVYDAYELYNLATDYGLSYGKLNFRRFPVQVSMLLLGNYNSNRFFNVEARLNDNQQSPYLFYRNFKPAETVNTTPMRSDFYVYHNLRLNRQDEIRLFTDFELRNEDKPKEMSTTVADVTLDFVLMPDETKRYSFRDRRIILHGMTLPTAFYHPDYSRRTLNEQPADYRRTLYWNPNAEVDEDGSVTVSFYNNSKDTRIKISAAGVSPDGRLLYY